VKNVKEIIEDFQSQYAHYSYWFAKQPDGSWTLNKQELHDVMCVDKNCILRAINRKKSIKKIYQDLRVQFKHVSYWFVKGWSEKNQKKHSEECTNENCILTTHRKKTTKKQALENGKKGQLRRNV